MNAASMPITPITEDTIEAYRRDGAVPLRGLFSADWIDLLRDGIEQAMADPGPTSKDYAPQGKGRVFTDHFL